MHMSNIITLLLVLLSAVICPYWKDLVTIENDKDVLNEEEVRKLLNFEYQPNNYFEEIMTQLSAYSHYIPGFIKETKSDCDERRDFSGPDVLQFLPQNKATIRNTEEVFEFVNDCFVKNSIRMISKENGKVVLSITSSEPTSLLCKDSYVLTTTKQFKVKIAFMKGEHEITFKGLDDDDMKEIAVNGIRLFGFCEDLAETVVSVYKTVKFYLNTIHHHDTDTEKKYAYYKDKSQEEVELDHLNFLKKFSNFTIENRGPNGLIPLPIEDTIQSGDFLGLTQIDSVGSTVLMYITGGQISHSAIALRLENNELYVAEMKGKTGLIISSWKDFVAEQILTFHSVVHCPLKEEYREKFNTQKAYEYFKSLGNLHYGGYNLMMSWFDVPHGGTANYLQEENILLFLSLIDIFDKESVYSTLGAALNIRLGTTNLTASQLTIEAAKRNLSFEELMAVPENDDWRYDNGDNLVCSSFVVSMYKVGGLFNGVNVNAKEFQPRDIYHLDFFDKEYERPQICKEMDPDLPYCQILGRYRLRFEEYSTLTPFDKMFENCPNVPPFYPVKDHC